MALPWMDSDAEEDLGITALLGHHGSLNLFNSTSVSSEP